MDIITAEEQLKSIEADLIVIDFYAEWCNPCKLLMPSITELVEEYKDDKRIKFVKVNIEKCPKLAEKYDIMSVPTIIFLHGGKTDFLPGLMAKKNIINKIETILDEITKETTPR
ncbi:MAG: thioredoxin family protein [Candidatus Pacearchaeota archaeon]|jgi:thioredoxin 1